jgi:hypothetical protein
MYEGSGVEVGAELMRWRDDDPKLARESVSPRWGSKNSAVQGIGVESPGADAPG